MTNPRLELLAPAGDLQKLKMAVEYGADAVYLGAPDFSLRAFSDNFSPEQMDEGIAYAHHKGAKVYLALNILAHPADMAGLRQSIRELLAAGPDAVIVSDPGVFSLIREQDPAMKIHISTQASVTNALACRFWYEQGASRIVLARELTMSEIGQIRLDVPPELELEAFVHGAMCMAYSGRCLLSNFYTERDSNRGRCSQPCRWKYQVVEEKRPDQPLTIEGDSRGSYIFSSRDLCLIEHIPAMAQAGLNSLKIEGRIKSAFYVATVVKAYREALDSYMADPDGYAFNPELLEDLKKTVHREFDTGFYFSTPQQDPKIFAANTNLREADFVGIVRAWLPDSGLILIEQRNKIVSGEWLELVQPSGRHLNIQASPILDLERRPIENTPHPQMMYYLPIAERVQPGAFIRRLGDKDQPAKN